MEGIKNQNFKEWYMQQDAQRNNFYKTAVESH